VLTDLQIVQAIRRGTEAEALELITLYADAKIKSAKAEALVEYNNTNW